MITYLLEVGLYSSNGMGMTPLSWVDIQAWSQLTGSQLTPSEARLMRKLSFIYVSQYNASKDIKCEAPYPDQDYVERFKAEQRSQKK